MIGCDACVDGALDGGFCHFCGDEVRVAGAEVCEEGEEGDLEGRGGVGVEAEVCFEDYETAGR